MGRNPDVEEVIEFGFDEDIEIPVRLANGKIKVLNVQEELSVSEETLSQDYMEQAGKYAWWAVLAESAKAQRDKKEIDMDKAEAEADKRVRKELELDGVKITESLVKSRIKLDSEYLEAVDAYNKAKKNAAVLDKLVRAFDHRKEMLISLGAQLREEKGNVGDLRSLKSKAKEVTNNN